jgi:hypothetical protein
LKFLFPLYCSFCFWDRRSLMPTKGRKSDERKEKHSRQNAPQMIETPFLFAKTVGVDETVKDVL